MGPERVGSLKRVLSVLENVNSGCSGFTLAKIAEIICQKYNKVLNETVKAKILKAVARGMQKKMIAKEGCKFRLSEGVDKKRVAKVSSVPSMTRGGSSAGGKLFESKSLMSTCTDRKGAMKKKKVPNGRKPARKADNAVKNAAKYSNRAAVCREFPANDIEMALNAIARVRDDNERLIQQCKNVNRSLKQRYNLLKRLRNRVCNPPTGVRATRNREIKQKTRKRNSKREWNKSNGHNGPNKETIGMGLSYVYDSNTDINNIAPTKENYGENSNKDTVQLE